MELVILQINYDECDNTNIRTYMTQDEEVILDFLEIEGIINHENIEDIIDKMTIHGQSMDIGYSQHPMRTEYRIKLIDMNNRKICIEL
jgi:hypothetical protein